MTARAIRRAVCLTVLLSGCSIAAAQPPGSRPTVLLSPAVPWAWYDPYYAITSRIHAQADLLRAHGDVAVDFALARNLHAEAVDRELDNWVKQVRAYWERKLIRERQRLELEQMRQLRNDQYLENEKSRTARIWDRLKNHPELTKVEGGEALNFLLQRLSGTLLSYEFVRQSGSYEPEMLTSLTLTPDQLHALSLQQTGRGGERLEFRADGNSGLDLEWWPYLLRNAEFESSRTQFESTRQAVIRSVEGDGAVDVEQLAALEQALAGLTLEFYERCDREDWRKADYARRCQYRAAETFLRRLDRELVRLQNTGDASAFRAQRGYDPERDGRHLVGLLTYMTRSGVEFAPARPGDEPVYHTVFAMLRDLYVTVADDDEGIQPDRPPATAG